MTAKFIEDDNEIEMEAEGQATEFLSEEEIMDHEEESTFGSEDESGEIILSQKNNNATLEKTRLEEGECSQSSDMPDGEA